MNRPEAVSAAYDFVNEHYPECQAALLAGSTSRGETRPLSDLDIVIFVTGIIRSYRESIHFKGWPAEIFVHSLLSINEIYEADRKRAIPSMQRMVFEGKIIKDNGIVSQLKKEAEIQLLKGPDSWPDSMIRMKRYFITDALEDLKDSSSREEQLFIVQALTDLLYEFYLRMNRQWLGSSKWKYRTLAAFDPDLTIDFMEALHRFYEKGETGKLLQLADRILKPFGGRLFDGFSLGKD
ncbi:nucleotidyltransferase domain-containing protein [Metabacillus sp. FJAT-52054]|uniref:Nucleotidyltransferase domain-containing protein n=1 Tax=Metabacillus sediminis TaxID=3117746 RepID=A0ABZ2NCL9_9BACI